MTDDRHINDPQPGSYTTRLVRGGPPVAARIYYADAERDAEGTLLEDERIVLELDGTAITDWQKILYWWTWLTPAREADVAFLRDSAAYERDYDPDGPFANPRRPIDLTKIPAIGPSS